MIQGKVTDPQGAPLADAIVKICEGSNEIVQLSTDQTGGFQCQINPQYNGYLLTLKASKAGYEPAQKNFRDERELRMTLTPLSVHQPKAPDPAREVPPSAKPPTSPSPRSPLGVKLVVAVAALAACALIIWAIVPKKVTVPNLDRMTIQEATNALAAVGLGWTIETVKADDSSADPGTVVSASPAAGTRLSSGKEVKLTVDPGVEVPDVVSINIADAEKMLAGLGFKSQIENLGNIRAQPEAVISQSPPAHDFAKKNSTINLRVNFKGTVSLPIGTVLVPQLLDLSPADLASARSSNPKLRLVNVGTTKAPGHAPGTVGQQSPTAGQKVSPNTTVSYWIEARP